MADPVVLFDLAGTEEAQLPNFYRTLFGWQADAGGALSVAVSTPLAGAFRVDPAEKRIYIGVPDVAERLAEITKQGGTVEAERFEVPGVAVLGLFRDPAGNPMGLVELDGTERKVP